MNKFNGTEIEEKTSEKKFSITSRILTVLMVAVIIAIIGFYVRFEINYELYTVENISMQPTFNEQIINADIEKKYDKVYVKKTQSLNRFEIVVFQDTEKKDAQGNHLLLIKRVIAIGGDEIDIIKTSEGDFKLQIKYAGTNLFIEPTEPYLADNTSMEVEYGLLVEYKNKHDYNLAEPIKIPDGHIFVMGDNRTKSRDSCTFGPVANDLVVGRADFTLKYGMSTFDKLIYNFKIKFIIK